MTSDVMRMIKSNLDEIMVKKCQLSEMQIKEKVLDFHHNIPFKIALQEILDKVRMQRNLRKEFYDHMHISNFSWKPFNFHFQLSRHYQQQL